MPYIPGRKSHKKTEKPEPQRRERAPQRAERVDDRPGDIDLLKLKSAYVELEAANRQIRETTIEMMMKMALAAEYKDANTGNHLVRISDYATEVAKAIGLSSEDVDLLRYASPMHDVGKIGIPDRILQKPGKLTPEEWDVMKTHTLIGARLFGNGQSRSPLLKAAAEIAIGHHEKFDGSGYPNALKGDRIPIFARIVAMVDVFDATLSDRCYKKKWPIEASLKYVKGLAGTHLDPDLVNTFTKIEKRILEIYEANASLEKLLEE